MRAVSSCQELKTQSFVEPKKFEVDSESDRVSNIRVSWYVFRSIRKFIRQGLAGGCSVIPRKTFAGARTFGGGAGYALLFPTRTRHDLERSGGRETPSTFAPGHSRTYFTTHLVLVLPSAAVPCYGLSP